MTQNFRILLVEDDDAIREMYRFKFENENIAVEFAQDGKDALKKAIRHHPDLLMLDIKIPTVGGDEVLEKLQKFDWAQQMKVVILTNINLREAPPRLRELHFDEYVVKAHSTPAKVVRLVRKLMDAK